MISSDLSSFGCHLSSDRWSQQLVFFGMRDNAWHCVIWRTLIWILLDCVGFLPQSFRAQDADQDSLVDLLRWRGQDSFGPPNWKVANWTDRNLPREECFFLCQRNREVPFWNPFDVIDIVTLLSGAPCPQGIPRPDVEHIPLPRIAAVI